MIKGAIFDIDGTLIDSMEMWEHAAERYLAGMGIEAEPHLQKKLYTFTITESAEYLKKNYSLSKTILEIIDGINETIGAFYRNEAEPKPGIIEFLSALQERKIPMTVATATDRVHIEAGNTDTGFIIYKILIRYKIYKVICNSLSIVSAKVDSCVVICTITE